MLHNKVALKRKIPRLPGDFQIYSKNLPYQRDGTFFEMHITQDVGRSDHPYKCTRVLF